MGDLKVIQIKANRWTEYRALKLHALKNDPLAFGSTYEDELLDPNEKWMQMFLSYDKYFIGVEIDGKIVSTMSLFRDSAVKSKHIGHIYNVYTEKSYRRLKHAQTMLEAIIEKAKLWEMEKLILSVTNTQTAAQNLYLKFGFEIIGVYKKQFKSGEDYYDEILMEKFL